MLGVGVGFDTDGAGSILVHGTCYLCRLFPPPPRHLQFNPCTSTSGPKSCDPDISTIVVQDSREGWVESVRLQLESHFLGRRRPTFNYTAIRPKGSPIKGFGGTASGSHVLKRLHADIDNILGPLAGRVITVTSIVDLMNCIGRCIVAGGVRQTAEIAFGYPNSTEYLDLKNYEVNPHRAAFGWTSNNSVYAHLGMDYGPAVSRIAVNGEPGFAWLENMRAYGRMGDPPDFKDYRAKGGNPCLEQTLESYELCCLVESFPHNHSDLEDFLKTLKVRVPNRARSEVSLPIEFCFVYVCVCSLPISMPKP
jgi:ribonucleoside-triphosphate reductase